jgi:two-component system chemotaxis response regulator CheB
MTSQFLVIAIGASAGALDAVRLITEALPRECAAAIAVVFHTGPHPSHLPKILSWHGRLPVVFGEEGAALEPGRIYVAPPDHHMLLEAPGRIRVVRSPVHNTRPAVDPLFASAAVTFGPKPRSRRCQLKHSRTTVRKSSRSIAWRGAWRNSARV